MVLFSLKPDLPETGREALFSRILELGTIPSVRKIEVGPRLRPSADWYRDHMSTEYGWALLADFEDETGLYAYQKDPLHVEVAREIRERVDRITVMDFVV
jgi:hypothetical protein